MATWQLALHAIAYMLADHRTATRMTVITITQGRLAAQPPPLTDFHSTAQRPMGEVVEHEEEEEEEEEEVTVVGGE